MRRFIAHPAPVFDEHCGRMHGTAVPAATPLQFQPQPLPLLRRRIILAHEAVEVAEHLLLDFRILDWRLLVGVGLRVE